MGSLRIDKNTSGTGGAKRFIRGSIFAPGKRKKTTSSLTRSLGGTKVLKEMGLLISIDVIKCFGDQLVWKAESFGINAYCRGTIGGIVPNKQLVEREVLYARQLDIHIPLLNFPQM